MSSSQSPENALPAPRSRKSTAMTVPQTSYDQAWHDLRHRIRLFYIIWLGGFAALAAVMILVDVTFGEYLRSHQAIGFAVFLPVGLAWLFGFMAAAGHRNAFRCPRCGKRFFVGKFFHNPYARRCLNCKLPRWAKVESPREDSPMADQKKEYECPDCSPDCPNKKLHRKGTP